MGLCVHKKIIHKCINPFFLRFFCEKNLDFKIKSDKITSTFKRRQKASLRNQKKKTKK